MMVDRHFLALATAQSLQVAALAAIVALAVRAFARNRPHLAHALWLIVLVKCLTPPLWSSPAGVFCWLQPRPGEARSESAAEPWQPLDKFTAPAFDDAGDNHATTMFAADSADVAIVENDDRGDSSVAIPATFVDDESLTLAAGDLPLHDNARTTARWLAGVWLAGSLTMIVVALVRGWMCWRLVRGSRTLIHPRLDRRVRVLCRQLGVRQVVRLTITESRVGPAVVGLLRPTILLPAAIVQGRKASELEPILAHELIHVRRGDLWVGLLQSLAQAVWWFHPLVWFAGRKIAREAERCCDEEVIAALACPPARYARGLLDVLELKQKLTAVPVFPGVRPVEVTSQRLERIMTLGQGCRRRTPWWCWAVMLLVAALVVGADEAVDATAATVGAKPGGSQPVFVRTTGGETPDGYTLTQELAIIAKDLGLSGDSAKQFLMRHLQATASIQPNADGPLGHWTDDTLVGGASPGQHERIANELARMRRYGCKFVEFEVYFAWGAPAQIEKIANRWTLLPTTVPREESLVNGTPVPAPVLPALVDVGDPPTNKASFVVEKKLPVMVEMMDSHRVDEVLAALQGDRRTNVMQAPKVTLSTGRTGEVFDCTQRPFVVGLQDGQPQIRVVREGRALRVLPILQGDTVRLDYELTQSTIRGVETITLPAHDGFDAITLQVPEVAKSRVESSVELPPGKSLLVGGLSTVNKKGEKESVLMLLKARPKIPLSAYKVGEVSLAADKMLLTSVNILKLSRGDYFDQAKMDRDVAAIQDKCGLAGHVFARVKPDVRIRETERQVDVVYRVEEGAKYRVGRADVTLTSAAEAKGKVEQATPQRLVGVGVNSDAGLTGVVVLDEQAATELLPGLSFQTDEITAMCKAFEKAGLKDYAVGDFRVRVPSDQRAVYLAALADAGALPANFASYMIEADIKPGAATNSAQPKDALDVAKLNLPRQALAQMAKPSDEGPRKRTEAETVLEKRLETTVTVKFKDAPLSQVMQHFAKIAHINLHLDPRGLAEEGVTEDTPVTIELSQKVSIKTALNLILESLHLCYVIRDEVLRITSEQIRDGEVYACVYVVEDLVKAKPKAENADKSKDSKGDAATPELDFKSLILLIKTTIQPTTWNDNGGLGEIQPHFSNLSLVVSQTRTVHEQIAQLLEELRRLQDVKVSLQIEAVPAKAIDERLKGEFAKDSKAHHKLLDPREASSLLGDGSFDGRRVSICYGQKADLGRLKLQSVVSSDRRSMRLTLAWDVGSGATDIVETIRDGHSVLLKLVPPPESGDRTLQYFLITPRIIVREKEEKKEAAAEQTGEITNFSFFLAR